MRRRILLAILATVALALVLAGTGTFLLLRRQAERATESGLRNQAEAIVGLIGLARTNQTGLVRKPKVVAGLRLEGIALMVVGTNGQLRGEVPEGVPAAELDASRLREGTTLSGRTDELTWAAASTVAPNSSLVAVITRTPEPPTVPVGWFLLAGGFALAVGAGVAAWLSDGLTRPLREAQLATVRIAAGDLSTPLPEPPPADHDEVAGLSRSINAMAGALAHSRGLERQFLLSVSHDLRTPLTSIRGYADAIAEGVGPDPVDAAKVIGSEARRLDRLVRDLLDLARLDAREFSFDRRLLDVNEVVVESAEGFRPTAEGAGIQLHVGEPGTAIFADIDPDRLAQAVANLVENGLKFAATTVWVGVEPEAAGGVVVHVVDDGPGIAPADVPHVFERLYVTDRRPSRQMGGTGLGLAIVRELVAGMGGQVSVTSPALPDARGARFTVALPAPATAPASPTPEAP